MIFVRNIHNQESRENGENQEKWRKCARRGHDAGRYADHGGTGSANHPDHPVVKRENHQNRLVFHRFFQTKNQQKPMLFHRFFNNCQCWNEKIEKGGGWVVRLTPE